ncbi:hypothetical protein PRIPAC_75271 [Pristionchus pacificus]|uniref:Uncharacterized protein n=1 Tax=Pristionchus pacificus TaxID=54126 RepID=A0A2A6CQS0_PRIPA|nr:hypothetical protein PRIPAC_75271 [Pristionchus pacificus]|eukprot:PDM80555.1 hypothetical protein PRIPAC_35558 [Pristionchus pacificus]
MNFAFLVVLLISIGLASAQLGQLLGFNQQQCPPCVCNNVVSQSQSQAQSQAQNQGGGGGGGGPPPGPPPGRGPGAAAIDAGMDKRLMDNFADHIFAHRVHLSTRNPEIESDQMKFVLLFAIFLVTSSSTDLGRLIGTDRGQCPPCMCNGYLVQAAGQGLGEGPGGFPSGGYPQGGTGGSGRSGVWSGGGGTVWG